MSTPTPFSPARSSSNRRAHLETEGKRLPACRCKRESTEKVQRGSLDTRASHVNVGRPVGADAGKGLGARGQGVGICLVEHSTVTLQLLCMPRRVSKIKQAGKGECHAALLRCCNMMGQLSGQGMCFLVRIARMPPYPTRTICHASPHHALLLARP